MKTEAYFMLLVITVCRGWRVVFKVGHGQSLSGAANLSDLWLSDMVVNDDRATYLNTQDTYMIRYGLTYKSSIVNSWNSVKTVKLGLYKDGREEIFMIFDAKYGRINWFKENALLKSSFSDLNPTSILRMAIDGSEYESFVIAAQDGDLCTESIGWMKAVDKYVSRSCFYDSEVPYFVYTNNTKKSYEDMHVADAVAIFVDDCAVNPCENGGSCHDQLGSFTCSCPDQSYGKTCNVECPCVAGTCRVVNQNNIAHNGIYINGTYINNDTFTAGGVQLACQCQSGMEGLYCGQSINDCAGKPCLNGGQCIDKLNSYTCECPLGISGLNCEVVSPESDTGMREGGVIAVGITVPLVVILLAAVIGYGIYIYKNPEGFGRSTTYRHFNNARQFVRRSFRRLSNRKPKPARRLQEDDVVEPKEKSGFDNLGFNDRTGATVPVVQRANSEVYELSANDQAVVTGPDRSYEMLDLKKRQQENNYQQLNVHKSHERSLHYGQKLPNQNTKENTSDNFNDNENNSQIPSDRYNDRYSESNKTGLPYNTGLVSPNRNYHQDDNKEFRNDRQPHRDPADRYNVSNPLTPDPRDRYNDTRQQPYSQSNYNTTRQQSGDTQGRYRDTPNRSEHRSPGWKVGNEMSADRHGSQGSSSNERHGSQSSSYDRHGSQSSGYDRQGSQSSGYDRHGSQSSGYDRHGSQSTGYDRYSNPNSPHVRYGNPTSPYDRHGGHNYNYDGSPSYERDNHLSEQSSDVRSPDQVVFVGNDDVKEVNI